MNKIVYSAVIYPCKQFDIFIHDYLESVFNQTFTDFELLLICQLICYLNGELVRNRKQLKVD